MATAWTPGSSKSGPPSGTAGGDLAGSYPNPSVAAVTTTTGPTSLVVGAVADGQFLKRNGATIIGAAGGGGLASVASTGNAGYTLVNGTGTILSYTTPNDGALHPVVVTFAAHLAGANGGETNFNIGGSAVQVLMASQFGVTGWFTTFGVGGFDVVMSLPANTAVTITQDGSMTVGSGILYIQILSA